MVVYPPGIEAEKSLIIYLYGKFHAKLKWWRGTFI